MRYRRVRKYVGRWVEWADFKGGWAPKWLRRYEARWYNRNRQPGDQHLPFTADVSIEDK